MTTNPYKSPQTSGESSKRTRGRWISRFFKVLTVLGIVVVLIALLLPNVRSASTAARRTHCANSLKLIALALREYETVHGALPPAYTVDAEGNPLHSWRTLILPYLGRQALYETIDLSKPWDDPVNQATSETMVPEYRCPAVNCPDTHTTYFAVVGPHCCFLPTEPRKLDEISDGHALTLMVVEVDAEQAVPWMSPIDATEQQILNLPTADNLPHERSFQSVLVSGQTERLYHDSKTEYLRALISIDGNDAITVDGVASPPGVK